MGKGKKTKLVVVWENRFLENIKLCSEFIPGKRMKMLGNFISFSLDKEKKKTQNDLPPKFSTFESSLKIACQTTANLEMHNISLFLHANLAGFTH